MIGESREKRNYSFPKTVLRCDRNRKRDKYPVFRADKERLQRRIHIRKYDNILTEIEYSVKLVPTNSKIPQVGSDIIGYVRVLTCLVERIPKIENYILRCNLCCH